ncbi:hypothetical protein Pla175_17470 [Pirellulimonas nuda]|uniref:Secreted protein n=1 Tax=Pirellulimonas nuda TaxID=2528009 RepID=A0A518DA59_9BACT|nr:hypothetical protein [Pirellulimonas nuda]QDU88372.1 hypothetical protein Pla175_17470 [Pirellulimonas nuda]
MHRSRFRLAASLACPLAAALAVAQQPTVTYEKDSAGVTYQVTRRPVAVQPQAQAYQQQVMVPVTEYRLVSRHENWWNPFAEPTWEHQWEPVTRWEARTATIQAPARPASTHPAAVATTGSLPSGGIALPSRAPRPFTPAPQPQQQLAARTSLAPVAGGQQVKAVPPRANTALRADTDDRYRR